MLQKAKSEVNQKMLLKMSIVCMYHVSAHGWVSYGNKVVLFLLCVYPTWQPFTSADYHGEIDLT